MRKQVLLKRRDNEMQLFWREDAGANMFGLDENIEFENAPMKMRTHAFESQSDFKLVFGK